VRETPRSEARLRPTVSGARLASRRGNALWPDAARATLLLREVEGLSYAEIAEALAIPKGTVMSRLYYARRQVQARLREAGVVEPSPGAGEEDAG